MMIKALEKQIRLELVVEKSTPQYLEGDLIKIRQILTHLVENAIIFTSEGSVEIHVKLTKKEKETAFVEFRIVDTGIGISEASVKHIFDFTEKDFISTSLL